MMPFVGALHVVIQDIDCPGRGLCCNNGCANVCLDEPPEHDVPPPPRPVPASTPSTTSKPRTTPSVHQRCPPPSLTECGPEDTASNCWSPGFEVKNYYPELSLLFLHRISTALDVDYAATMVVRMYALMDQLHQNLQRLLEDK